MNSCPPTDRALLNALGGAFLALAVLGTSPPASGQAPTPPSSDSQSPTETHATPASAPPEHSPTTNTPIVDIPEDLSGSRLAIPRPIADFAEATKKRMAKYGWVMNIDVAFYEQYATDVLDGQKNFGTFAWRVWSDWNFLTLENGSRFSLEWALLGSPGLNYNVTDEQLTRNVGAVSLLNANYYPNPAALDEFIVKASLPSVGVVGLIGRTDLSNRFDTNRVANDGFRQFVSFPLQNNLSIPWSDYGGAGGVLRYNHNERLYVMVAGSESDSDEPFAFWKTAGQGNWYEMAEVGAAVDVPWLGVGHYRLTPWHSHTEGEDGWGVGINFDQELGRSDVVAFFRFGIGDPDVTPVKTFVSAGAAWLGPFGRKNDMTGIGFAFSDPSPGTESSRDETLFEIFYRLAVRPWIQISPDLQVVIHPASNPSAEVVWIPGVRLNATF